MTIVPPTREDGIFIAHGKIFKTKVVVEGESQAGAIAEFMEAANVIVRRRPVFLQLVKRQAL